MPTSIERKLLMLVTILSAATAFTMAALAWQLANSPSTVNRHILCIMASELQSPRAWEQIKQYRPAFPDIQSRHDEGTK